MRTSDTSVEAPVPGVRWPLSSLSEGLATRRAGFPLGDSEDLGGVGSLPPRESGSLGLQLLLPPQGQLQPRYPSSLLILSLLLSLPTSTSISSW